MKSLSLAFARALAVALLRILPGICVVSPYISARMCLFTIKRSGNAHSQNKILCIERNLFSKDVAELSHRLRTYEWLTIKNGILGRQQSQLVPQHYQKQTEYAETLRDKISWEKCLLFGRIFIREALKRDNIVAVMTANMDYWQDHSIRMACQTYGLPFFVVSKECASSPHAISKTEAHYANFKFNGTAIACFSEHYAETLRRLDVAPRNCIYTTGAPRLDRYRSIDVPAAPGSSSVNVVWLSFRAGYGAAEGAYFELLRNTIGFLDEWIHSGNTHLIIKTKNLEDTTQHALAIGFSDKVLQNVSIGTAHNMDLYDVLPGAKAIIGMNSLSVVEALIADAAVILPTYLSQRANKEDRFFGFDRLSGDSSVRFVGGENEFFDALSSALMFSPNCNREIRNSVIRELLGYGEHISASAKVAAMLSDYINQERTFSSIGEQTNER